MTWEKKASSRNPIGPPQLTVRLRVYFPKWEHWVNRMGLRKDEWSERVMALGARLIHLMKQGLQTQLVEWQQNPLLKWSNPGVIERDEGKTFSRTYEPKQFFPIVAAAYMPLPDALFTKEHFNSMFSLVLDFVSGLPSQLLRKGRPPPTMRTYLGEVRYYNSRAALCLGEDFGKKATDSEDVSD